MNTQRTDNAFIESFSGSLAMRLQEPWTMAADRTRRAAAGRAEVRQALRY